MTQKEQQAIRYISNLEKIGRKENILQNIQVYGLATDAALMLMREITLDHINLFNSLKDRR